MYPEPSFLSKKDILAFRRDTCIFCNGKFKIEKTGEKVGEEKRGSHYTEHYVNVLYKTFLISDLDIYLFGFEFNEDILSNLSTKQEEIIKKIKKEKLEEAPKLRVRLEKRFGKSNLNLSKRLKNVAVNAIVEDYLSEIYPPNFEGFSDTNLEKRIKNMFHNLRLEDLQLIERGRGADLIEKSDDYKFDCIKNYYDPSGLKTHQKCWPFNKFNDSTEFHVKFGDFVEYIQRNKKFASYDSLFKKFPKLWKNMLDSEITIKAEEYNPVDYVKSS